MSDRDKNRVAMAQPCRPRARSAVRLKPRVHDGLGPVARWSVTGSASRVLPM